MAEKRIAATVEFPVPASKASPAPPVGARASRPHGVLTIMDCVKAYDAAAEAQVGTIVPVDVAVFKDQLVLVQFLPSPADAGPAGPEGPSGEGSPPGAGRARPRAPRVRRSQRAPIWPR